MLWESTLLYPILRKPNKEDIVQWQYMLNSISALGQLHVPLGYWRRAPDQRFKYLLEQSQLFVYKRGPKGWTVFGRKRDNSRRFAKLRITAGAALVNSML